MASTLEEVTALLSLNPSSDEQHNEDQNSWRTARLKEVLAKAEKAWLNVSHESLALAAEAVADAARDREFWPPILNAGENSNFFFPGSSLLETASG